MQKPQPYISTIVFKEKVSSKVYVAVFSLSDGATIAFVPGQNVMLRLAPQVNRVMSIASPPSENTAITLAYDVSPAGAGSRWMIQAALGQTVRFMGPMGVFTFDAASPRKKIFVATGTGVAPFRSMIRDYLENGGTDDLTLYWGFRCEEDIFWMEEFTELSVKYPHFRFSITLSQPHDGWQGKRGRVTAHVPQEEANLPGSDFYLCGNRGMVDDMTALLLSHGVPKLQIKSEFFFR